MVEKTIKRLKENGFNAIYCNDKEAAAGYILNSISTGDTVGFGGSMTIKSLEIKDEIIKKGGIIIDHNVNNLTREQKFEVMREELYSDLFLCSSNAITEDGELVNVDGNGNRVAAMMFGPKKVIIVVGINKLCKNLEEAYNRIELFAGPKNNKRLNCDNPCVKTGRCVDCKSPNRICKAYTILKRKTSFSDVSIIVVNEELGY